MSDLSPLCAQKRTSVSRAAMLTHPPYLFKEILSRWVCRGLSSRAGKVKGFSGRGFESLEAQREPLPVREILGATWQMYGAAIEQL